MKGKRITLLAGHYGSGKTNIALNLALAFKKGCDGVVIADLDIVNPYFRTKDSAELLSANGVRLISSAFANTNVDLPALPQEMYAITDDTALRAVVDVGGDDRGALALGRLAPAILRENDFEMLLVINRYRPLTRTPEDCIQIQREIETAGGIPFTGIVNNSNLGEETNAETVLSSVDFAEQLSLLTGLPIRFTAVSNALFGELEGKIPDLFPLKLQNKIK